MNEELKTLPSPEDLRREHVAPTSGSCLSNDEILTFVQGQLAGNELSRLHSHVDACDVCQRLLVEAAHAVDAESMSESVRPSWNTVFQSNAVIGKRYRVLRLVGRGGMGEIYEAYDTALHERVALKTVTSTNCDSAQAVRYLKAEVQLARRISHPNVCRIYDLGTHVMDAPDGEICFLVMEFVEGECLGQRLRQSGAFSIELASSIAHQLLLGLHAAHQAGILHRDFKSDNVMLRHESNGRVTPVILDFGLARALNEHGIISATQSQGQSMVGTIGYMAPEQIEGEPLSTASDLYAFGVVWFELLTGKLPFEAETPVASAMARLHRSAVAPSSLNAKVPGWMDEIVLRCLNRHRSNRFATAEQVLDALSAAKAGLVSEPSQRVRTRRGSAFIGLSSLVAMAGIATIVLTAAKSKPVPVIKIWSAKPPPLSRLVPPSRPLPVEAPSATPRAEVPVASSRPAAATPASARRRVATSSQAEPPQKRAPLPKAGTTALTAPEPALTTSASGTLPASPRKPDWLPIWSKKTGSESPAVAK